MWLKNRMRIISCFFFSMSCAKCWWCIVAYTGSIFHMLIHTVSFATPALCRWEEPLRDNSYTGMYHCCTLPGKARIPAYSSQHALPSTNTTGVWGGNRFVLGAGSMRNDTEGSSGVCGCVDLLWDDAPVVRHKNIQMILLIQRFLFRMPNMMPERVKRRAYVLFKYTRFSCVKYAWRWGTEVVRF